MVLETVSAFLIDNAFQSLFCRLQVDNHESSKNGLDVANFEVWMDFYNFPRII